ncbi:hypothetical protein D1816_08850 [Aquimarina sp. AD10]|uniref:M949_RS01915 family surface polysaccharide biosynthesis protein n=1 Tax=Aquimarina sp. AD10 TaxID=1714849 RepID=UPI000E550472|nr:hypothetical protein [Aquimarina sp. AD10]AXT60454.1 hypothetical protein D1816_08850 [Aquimarina sp. AD10]RKM96939.1 hypothetical protein D7033_14575 [Aquimarina sp. AD10]
MNKLILSVLILALFSCGKQSKEPKKEEQQPISIIDLKRNDPITINPELIHKLSKKEITKTFTKRIKKKVGAEFEIYQAYSYNDQSEQYYLLLLEDFKGISEENDTLNNRIQALRLSYKDKQFKKKSSIKDDIDQDWETSIDFWNNYTELSDIDNDGLTDLILVYGTKGQDGYVDGRVKIMIYHNKKRVTIRHQNSGSSDGRLTKINSKFYTLPVEIQKAVKEKIQKMIKNKHAAFAGDWEKEMSKEATRLEEK